MRDIVGSDNDVSADSSTNRNVMVRKVPGFHTQLEGQGMMNPRQFIGDPSLGSGQLPEEES